MSQPRDTTSQPTAPHGTAAYTLFFNLSHEAFADKTYFLVGGGRRYALTKVSDQPQVLARARQTNAFLRAVPNDQITHHSENVVLATDAVTLSYLYADINRQAGTWSMSAVNLLIPPGGAAAAYAAARTRTPSGPLPLSAKRRLYGLPAAQTAQDLREERALLDTTTHAATIVGAHPDLFSLEPTAANIVHSNHIDTSIGVKLLSTQLRRRGPATPQTTPGQPNQTGWGTLVPVIDDTTGQPLVNTKGQNAGRLQYQPSFHPDIAAAAGTALRSVTPPVKNDTSLGADVTGLNPDPNEPPNPALNGALWLRHDGFANTDQRGLAGVGDQTLAMALKHTTPGDWLFPDASATRNADGSVEVSLSLLNWALRFVGVYLQFLSTKTNPPTPIALSQIPEYTNNTIIPGHDSSLDTPTEFFVGLLGPTFTILGIPVAPGFLLPRFQVPASADMVRILTSGLSFQGSNNYPDTVLPGAIMTGVFNYGVTALMAAAGAGATFSAILKTVVIPLAQALAQELVAIISQALNSTGASDLVDMLGKASFWEGQALAVAKTLLTYAAGGAVGRLVAAIVGAIGVAEVEDAIPIAGWIMLGVSIAVGVASIIETSVELSQVPWTDIDDLSFTHDLSVTILKDPGNPPGDPGDDTFPKAADHYKVTALFDDGTPQVQTLTLPQPVPATLPPVVFPGVPLGGNVNVSVAFTQLPTDPFQPAGGVLLGKGTTGLIPNTLGATPTITIQELQFPITANTTYVHKQKTAVDPSTGRHVWDAQAAAPTVNAGNLVSYGPGTLYGFRSITVRQGTATAQGYVGYAWQGWNSGGAGALDQMANLNTADAETGYVASAFGFTQPGVRLSYNMLSGGSANFYLDTTDPNHLEPHVRHLHVRQVTLDPTPTFDSPLSNQSWGVFALLPDSLLLHPTGHLVSISRTTHTMATHRLPDAFMTDAEAAVHLLAQVKSGPGTRPGLMTAPTVATIAPDGTILVLEAGDPNATPTPIPSRLQAFNLGANAIPFFTKQADPYFLTLTATPNDQGWQYLDIAAEYSGLLYVLSYNENTFLYRLDIYDPTQAGTTPISTTQHINAAKLTVDFWRNVYTLNYEVLQLSGPGITEPTVSLWVPTDSHTGANHMA